MEKWQKRWELARRRSNGYWGKQKSKFIDAYVNEGYSLVHILDGECVVELDGEKYTHRKGDTLY